METVNKKLRDLCNDCAKKKTAIAKDAGISPQRLNDILSGRRPLSMNLVIPICIAIDSEPNTLFGWNNKKKLLADQIRKIVVIDTDINQEIAVVTNKEITTAGNNIVVKLEPSND